MSNIISLKYVASITGVNIKMDSSKDWVIVVEYREKQLSLKSIVMSAIIMNLDYMICVNLKTQLMTTSW